MAEITVSACIVTYNNEKMIAQTLSALLQQTKGVDLKLYVVDNGSTDATIPLIQRDFPSVELIKSPRNVGFGAGHNQVISLLDSDFHAVVNPDIILESDVLASLARFMREEPSATMLSPKIICQDGSEQLLGKQIPHLKYLAAHWLYQPGKEPGRLMQQYCSPDEGNVMHNATGCFMFFRTEEFVRLGGFDERFFMYLEDCDIARRTRKAVYVPTVSVKHLWERGSKKNKKLLAIHVCSIIKYHWKWMLKKG